MPAPPPAVLWIDPGLSTGLAILERGTKFRASQHLFQRAGDLIFAACAEWKRGLAIGWERFDIRPGTHKLTRQPEAAQMIGVARFFATAYHCQILAPAAPHTPDAADNRRLRALGWYRSGEDDARSAATHLLRWLEREGCLPVKEAGILAALRADA